MENASKALIIAGGMLLAIITLSLIVYMTTSLTTIGEAQDEKTAAEQLTAFNMEYEAYRKSVMYGTDIITVYNKAMNNNQTNEYQINIKVYDIDENEISVSYEQEFKNKIFECRDVNYNETTGRIYEMIFYQINISI